MSSGGDGAGAVENQRFGRPSTTGEPREPNPPDRNHPRDITHVLGEWILPGSSVAGALEDRDAAMVHAEWDHRREFQRFGNVENAYGLSGLRIFDTEKHGGTIFGFFFRKPRYIGLDPLTLDTECTVHK